MAMVKKKRLRTVRKMDFHVQSGNIVVRVERHFQRQPLHFNFHGFLQVWVSTKEGKVAVATLAMPVVVF